jgi:aldose 1-epimerase
MSSIASVLKNRLLSKAFRRVALLLIAMVPMQSAVNITRSSFGSLHGKAVDLYTLTNSHGMSAAIITLGGTIVRLNVPDRSGKSADVVLGFDKLSGYEHNSAYLGALIGRYANRIAKGQFTLDNHRYQVPVNDSPNSLHGGTRGFDQVVWTAATSASSPGALELTMDSPDGDQGFPGNLRVKVVYTLSEDNSLRTEYTAETDRTTIVNLTNHAYFNLSGAGSGTILDHRVTIHGSRFTPVDSGLIPTGELVPVKGTPFDFLQPHAVGERINSPDPQLRLGKGYDHNWVLDSGNGELAPAAEVYDPKSGRVMQVLTTQPGVQFYTANSLDAGFGPRTALCLETQHFPDSPNHPNFPSTTLRPGQTFKSTTVWKFSTR